GPLNCGHHSSSLFSAAGKELATTTRKMIHAVVICRVRRHRPSLCNSRFFSIPIVMMSLRWLKHPPQLIQVQTLSECLVQSERRIGWNTFRDLEQLGFAFHGLLRHIGYPACALL